MWLCVIIYTYRNSKEKIMTTQRQTKHQRNFVAANARKFNKCFVEVSKKQKQKHNKPKHKGTYAD